MRTVAVGLFLAGMLAVTSFTDAQPPGGGGKGGQGPGGFGKGGFGGGRGFAQPGQVMPAFLQDVLKMSDDQKKQLADLQKDVDTKLDKILTDDQKKQLKEMKDRGPFGGGFGGGKGGDKGGFPGGKGDKGGPGGDKGEKGKGEKQKD